MPYYMEDDKESSENKEISSHESPPPDEYPPQGPIRRPSGHRIPLEGDENRLMMKFADPKTDSSNDKLQLEATESEMKRAISLLTSQEVDEIEEVEVTSDGVVWFRTAFNKFRAAIWWRVMLGSEDFTDEALGRDPEAPVVTTTHPIVE